MRRFLVTVLTGSTLAASTAFAVVNSMPYHASVMSPSAINLVAGTPLRIKGFPAGTVEKITAVGDKARIDFTIDRDHAPLHDGASATIAWKALLGERYLDIADGPANGPVLPDGAMLPGTMAAPVEIDDVLSMLDPPTREKLASLLRGLDSTVTPAAPDINATLASAGPAVGALGDVLRGVGTDGQAIRQLLTRVNGLTGALSSRDAQLRDIIAQLADSSQVMATRGEQLRQVLAEVPGTLDKATTVLGTVPDTVDAAGPLLDDLRPATEKLVPVAANLRPLLADLRPTIADLRPTLDSASQLLGVTPGLLDSLHETVPKTNQALVGLTPALDFLRPYAPEMVGWMANWGSAMSNYDANGHYTRGMVQTGVEAWNANPGITGPGVTADQTPPPGAAAGEPWTDAFGDGMN
jgi:phospholipid/cholesterol/gamma-HCH transport system substrate-binding protein